MPTSARGSKAFGFICAMRPGRGFTLIELLLVVALIAVASGLASLALRDPAASRLDREGARLAMLLEAARAEARAGGLAVVWRPAGTGAPDSESVDFRFVGLPKNNPLPTHWLEPGVIAHIVGAPVLSLGPEPMIGAQRVVLRLQDQQLALATDGLGPFAPVTDDVDASER
ncbi:MAG: prepilin-type N-terminal cleavage/methylation domain-containing protein [Burkholderiaceae bacterium]|nr:prepilin-type N-terminal cleavage/methylation domain-containing protein [Burkholderiaceae bacterium]